MATKPVLNNIGNDPISGAEITREPHNENYALLNNYTEAVSQDLGSHIGSPTAHLDSAISNTSNVAGLKVSDALNTTKAKLDAHVDGTADKHGSDDIINESSTIGVTLSDAIDTVQQQVNALVVSGTPNTTIGVYSLTAGGVANAYTGTFAGVTLFGGLKVNATFNTINTGASTFNFNSTGVKSIKVVLATGGKSDLKGGELYGKVLLEYDGTDFVVVEKNFLNGGTSSTAVTVTQPITTLPTSVIKGRADWKVEGNTLNQIVTSGNVSSTLTANATSRLIDINTDGTIEFNSVYDATNKTFDIITGNKYFLVANASAGTFLNAVYLYYSDGTNQSVVGAGQSATPYGIITANKTLKANFKLSEGAFTGTLTKASMMIIPMTGTPYESYTADQMNALVTMYFEGLQGVKDVRVKSVGKNLLNLSKIPKTGAFVSLTDISDNSVTLKGTYYAIIPIKLSKNKTYRLSCTRTLISGSGADQWLIQYSDGTTSSAVAYGNTITTDSSKPPASILLYASFASQSEVKFTNLILNEGTTILSYEPYTETETYLPVTLNKLPNLVTDSVEDDGVFVNRIGSDTDISSTKYASIDLATYTNVDVVKTTAFTLATAGTTAKDNLTIVRDKNGVVLEEVAQANIDLVSSVGKYYYHTDKTIWFIVANGAYADIASARTGLGTSKALYQLATPITTQLQVSNIIAEPSGTLYVDNIYSDVDFYGTNITVAGRTFNSIEKVLKIDKDTGTETDITSTCALTAGKDGFTSTTLVSGDLVWFALESTGTMIPTLTYSYPLDIKAALESNSNAVKQIDNQLSAMQDYIYNPVMQVSVTTGFLANWSGLVKYSKNKEGMVSVYVDLLRSADILATAEILLTLPLGYRPANLQQITANLLSATDVSIASSYANISINTAGQITILPVTSTTLTNARSIMLNFNYYSA